ncbi:hypothetical protein [Brevibacillus sp. SYSU BS000544]|uniref:hypothetical protein n=1 Tax=Brevibacillus sp. SYSU BS000544 TaxID=3416443 RepID=UPI003CE554BB
MFKLYAKLLDKIRAKQLSKKLGVKVDVVYYQDQGDLLNKEQLSLLLNQYLTPALNELELHRERDYCWIGETNSEGIRKVVQYTLLKGRGTLSWGVALDFLLIPSGNRLVYQRTGKTARVHLFEWTEGYKSSFIKGKLVDGFGVTSHISKNAEETMIKLVNKEVPLIKEWYEKAKDLSSIIEIAEKQAYQEDTINVYNIHYPPPKYVLAFLYAKIGKKEEAVRLLDEVSFLENDDSLRTKVKQKLLEL